MNALPATAEIDRFAALLTERIGMQFPEARYDELGRALQQRAQALSLAYPSYLDRLGGALGRTELAQLARDLTIGETYFLRNMEQFQALQETVLQEFAGKQGPLQILSAGCASGEEAYSIAILLRERFPERAVQITAFDLNPAVLQKAERGIYGNWSLRVCPEPTRSRWFRTNGNQVELDPAIRGMVRFEQRNLAEPAPAFWLEGRFDVIFCRNVLMYFSAAQAQAAVARLAYALTPGGYLFLGHAETLRGLSNAFHLCHTHDAFYYRRKVHLETDLHEDYAGTPGEPLAMQLAGDTGWFDAIQQASARVHALTSGGGIRHEVQAVEADDDDSLLLKAIDASHDGKLDEAEALCRKLLASDDMSAGAHYVLALCCEGRGKSEDSFEHDRIAAYLDPGFAMPRLHMGLSLRRMGQRKTAREELQAAATLLQLEDPARVLLFGGGFQREALIALCRAELSALEAA